MFELKTLNQDDTGVRVGVVKSSECDDILTPIPALTSTDIRYIKKIKAAGFGLFKNGWESIPHQIVEVVKFFNPEVLEKLTDSEVSQSHVKQLQEFTYAGGKLAMFRPVIDRKIEIPERINKILTEIQLQAEFDLITIQDPKFNSSPTIFEKMISKMRDYIYESTEFDYVEPIPMMRLDMPKDLFEEKLKILINNGFKGVSLIYSPYYHAYPNYLHLRKLSEDNDIFIHLSSIPKTWHENKKTSMMHLMQLWGIDSFSYRTLKLPAEAIIKIKLKLARRFDNRSWGIIDINEHKKMWSDDLNCKCPVCEGRDLKSFLKVYSGSDVLSAAMRIHDIYDGHKEFMIGRMFALSNEFKKYVRQKSYAIPAINKIFKTDLLAKQLGK
jgi:hypothetical protein